MRSSRSGLGRLAALLVLAVAPAGAQTPAPLPVMTFNIRYGTAADGEDAWAQRRPLVMRMLHAAAPDLLGVQEALRFQLDEIRAEFTGYGEIGVGRDDGRVAGEYSAILYDRARLEPLEQGTFWLSDTPETPGSVSWGNRITRIVTWARFRDRTDNSTFYFFNTHWDHESQDARERSAALLLARIAARTQPGDPVIVSADFNAGERNAAFLAMTDSVYSGLRDSFRVRHPAAANVGTFHGFKGGSGGEKIDAVLVGSGWEVLDAAIIRTAENGRYPSDHYPVTALLRRTR